MKKQMSLRNQMRYFKVTSLPKFRLKQRDFSVFKTLVKKKVAATCCKMTRQE